MFQLARWMAAQFDGGITRSGVAIALLMLASSVGALLALASDALVLASSLAVLFLAILVLLAVSTRLTPQPQPKLQASAAWQPTTMALCLAWAGLGFAAAAGLLRLSPWPVYGNVLTALATGLVLGVPELFLLRRFFPRLAARLRLNEDPFPYAALGAAGAVIVLGLR